MNDVDTSEDDEMTFHIPDTKKAIGIAWECAQFDGGHHRLWVIEEMLKALLGEQAFEQWIIDYEADGEYEWTRGIAP
jgi:hypothetical protein